MGAAGNIADSRDDTVVAGGGIVRVLTEGFAAHAGDFSGEFFNEDWVVGLTAGTCSVQASVKKVIVFGVVDEGAPFKGEDQVIISFVEVEDL